MGLIILLGLIALGIAGLRGQLKITSKRAISGPTAKKLGGFYLAMAVLYVVAGTSLEISLGTIGIVLLVTLVAIFTIKGDSSNSISPKGI